METAGLTDILLAVFTLLYCAFLWWIRSGWKKCILKSAQLTFTDPEATAVESFSGLTKLSIVVAFRNEAMNIRSLLASMVCQRYPLKLVEFIFVDDHSEDGTADLIKDFFRNHSVVNYKVIQSKGAGKKAAIAQGIESAWHELIITTDADCILSGEHISYVVSAYEKNQFSLLAGPVKFEGEQKWLTGMQKLEMAGLTAIAGGAIENHRPMMCNGANLSFRRSTWMELVKGHYHNAASGDDTDLLNRFYEAVPDKVFFAASRNNIVRTPVMNKWSDFLEQRKRWASKIVTTMNGFTIMIAVLVWIVHAMMTMHLFLLLTGHLSGWFLLSILIKAFSESMVIDPVLKLYGEEKADKKVLFHQPVYWLYITFSGPAGLILPYRWKSRRTR